MPVYWPFFLFTFLSLEALAQIQLAPIQVQATKSAKVFNFGSSSHFSQEDLTLRPQTNLKQFIDSVPGVISNQNGGPGGRVSFFIRGTESRHVSFTLDGLKLNDVSGVDRQFDAAFLTSPILQELNVYKGPQAVLFGSDALGGLVDMRTRKGERAPETRVNFFGGSFGTVGGSLSSDWKAKKNQGTLTYSMNHSDGISRLNKKRFHAKEADSSDISQATSSSRHFWQKNQTDLLLSFVNGKNELDGATSDNSYDHSTNHQYLMQQKTSHFLDKNTALSLRNGLNRHQRFIHTRAQGAQTYSGNSIQNELLMENKSRYAELMGGLATEHEDVLLSQVDRSFDLNSAFLQSLFKLKSFSFQAGGRLEHHSRYGSFQTGSTGIAYQLARHKFFTQYSQGFKAPSLFQLYYPIYGNRNLVPERNHSWETGWKLEEDDYGLNVTIFKNKLSNLVTFTSAGYRNQGDFIAEGVEVSGRLTASSFVFKPSFVQQNFRKQETVVLRRPQNMISLQASWFAVENLEFYTKFSKFSARKDQNTDLTPHTVKLNGFETVDVGARYVDGMNDYSFQIVNLLNREYEELYGYSVMPRSVFVGFGRRFL
jgi:vitamin B12 transporter